MGISMAVMRVNLKPELFQVVTTALVADAGAISGNNDIWENQSLKVRNGSEAAVQAFSRYMAKAWPALSTWSFNARSA